MLLAAGWRGISFDMKKPAQPVRWLAESCGLPPAEYVPHLASRLVELQHYAAPALSYCAWWARHPDRDSNFARVVADLLDHSDQQLFVELRRRHYDGLLYLHGGSIVGHCFFQRRDDELHAFSLWFSEA